MEIKLKKISVKELTEGFMDNAEQGVVGYDGKLDIRPPYQREFVYKDKQRDAVIETVTKGHPLNVMYWAVRDDGNFEIIDGQQRTISLCQYVQGDFSVAGMYFHNLPDDKEEQILQYPLMVYLCSGKDSEKLEWFKTINIAGERLTNQELRNAVYSGSWVSDAKKYFSKTKCPASRLGDKYLDGKRVRQEYLETAISWISNGEIEDYMGKNQHVPNAKELWNYFQEIIGWVKAVFPNSRPQMKGQPWGPLYAEHGKKKFDPAEMEAEVKKLFKDHDVTNKKGIYLYVLDRKEKHLNIRAFSDDDKAEAYENQNGNCAICGEHFDISEMEGDHITPWNKGGKTKAANCQMLCKECNRRKGAK